MGYSLNLAVQDTCRSIQVMSAAFDVVLELSKIFKYSTKKKAMLLNLKHELAPGNPGIKPLLSHTMDCERAESFWSVIINYNVIMTVPEEIMEEYKGNFEACYQTRGILTIMETFQFLFDVVSEKVFLSLTSLVKHYKRRICWHSLPRNLHLLQYVV